MRAAVGPAILLPEAGHIVRVRGTHRHPRLGLAIGIVEVRAREAALGRTAATRRERSGDADRRRGRDRQRRRKAEPATAAAASAAAPSAESNLGMAPPFLYLPGHDSRRPHAPLAGPAANATLVAPNCKAAVSRIAAGPARLLLALAPAIAGRSQWRHSASAVWVGRHYRWSRRAAKRASDSCVAESVRRRLPFRAIRRSISWLLLAPCGSRVSYVRRPTGDARTYARSGYWG